MSESILQMGSRLPFLILLLLFFLAIFYYKKERKIKVLIWIAILFRLFLALAKTLLQYYWWNQDEVTRRLLHSSIDPSVPGWLAQLPLFNRLSSGYFLYYSMNHFWINAILSVVGATVIYAIFKSLHAISSRFFKTHEINLAFLMALLTGWPQILLFLPMVFLMTTLFSLVNWRKKYHSLSIPIFISTACLIIFSQPIRLWIVRIFSNM